MESMFYYCNLQYLLLLLLHCICSSVSSSPGHLPLRLLLLRLLLLRRDGDVLQEVAEVLGDGWVAAAHTSYIQCNPEIKEAQKLHTHPTNLLKSKKILTDSFFCMFLT